MLGVGVDSYYFYGCNRTDCFCVPYLTTEESDERMIVMSLEESLISQGYNEKEAKDRVKLIERKIRMKKIYLYPSNKSEDGK